MKLLRYFETNDGSLPEIELIFSNPEKVSQAFELLLASDARDVTAGGGSLWLKAHQKQKPFMGSGDAALVIADIAEPFHVVLAGITSDGCTLPDLGVLVTQSCLTIDYRMGHSWREAEVRSFLVVLKKLCEFGGTLSVPWWGTDGEQVFMEAIRGTKQSVYGLSPQAVRIAFSILSSARLHSYIRPLLGTALAIL
ncbi:hypothetical protein EAW52_25010 [Pseudomonas sp. LTJR-52]|uniref:hypothetical protein n=1 Tax=Pseudomonas sp. LTJR-52 TaxID=2479392 RepID=UPI000EFC36C2|nr:hypothetical protein [Pseudomonas sp. LTJR-52]AYN96956.1 hypothetical protein EAW52_25010 [Pseudomonas sp. LTJR-52]